MTAVHTVDGADVAATLAVWESRVESSIAENLTHEEAASTVATGVSYASDAAEMLAHVEAGTYTAFGVYVVAAPTSTDAALAEALDRLVGEHYGGAVVPSGSSFGLVPPVDNARDAQLPSAPDMISGTPSESPHEGG